MTQFARFTGNMLQCDLGFSYRTRQPLVEMIADRIPATLELGIVALLISLIVGIPAGVYTALKPRGAITQTLHMTTLIGVTLGLSAGHYRGRFDAIVCVSLTFNSPCRQS